MPIGHLDSNYVAQSNTLADYGTTDGDANLEQDQRMWMVPELNGASWDIPGWAAAYSRKGIGDVYTQVLSYPSGSAGDAMAMKMQSDYVATQERAYRLRQLSPVRACMHAAARRLGHGQDNGIFGRIDSTIQDVIAAGAAGFSS
jgi:hypothetical protein